MSAQLFFLPFNTLYTSRGLPAGGGKVYFYLSGTTTLTPVYADAGLTTQLPNPVPTDGLGVLPAIYLSNAIVYRVEPQDVNGAQLGPPLDPYVPGVSADTAAAASAAAAAASAITAGTNATNAATSAATAATQGNAATLASATAVAASLVAGAYPNAAATNVPQGLTQASVGALTAGSGGTNGTFALAWSSGNFTVNPTGTFTVAGGVLTAVTITGPGLYIGASPTIPTPSFAASTGLTGAAVALTIKYLIANGVTYWVQSSDNTQLLAYRNVGGTATSVSGLGPQPLNVATLTAAAAASAAAAAASAASITGAIATTLLHQVDTAKGKATLNALFCADGPKTYSSGTNMATWGDSSPAGLSAVLYSTLWSGSNPRPIDNTGSITFYGEAGLNVSAALLPNTQNSALFFDFDNSIQTKVSYATHAALVTGGATANPYDIGLITGGPLMGAPTGGIDPPFVMDSGIADANLWRGYWRKGNYSGWNSTDGDYDASMTDFQILSMIGASSQFLTIGFNRAGQLQVSFYNGPGGTGNVWICRAEGQGIGGDQTATPTIEGRHFCALHFARNTMFLYVDGKLAGTCYIGTENCTAFTTTYFNGNYQRSASVNYPIRGLTHKVKVRAAISAMTSFAEFRATHDALATYADAPRLDIPSQLAIIARFDFSRGDASTNAAAAWPYTFNSWNGEVKPVNASLPLESFKITSDNFDGRVLACAGYNNPKRIGMMRVGINTSGSKVDDGGFYSPSGEGSEFGIFRQLLSDADSWDCTWALVTACQGAGVTEQVQTRTSPTVPYKLLAGKAGAGMTFVGTGPSINGSTVQSLRDKGLAQIAAFADFARWRGQAPFVAAVHIDDAVNGGSVPTGNGWTANMSALLDTLKADFQHITNQTFDPVFFTPVHSWSDTGSDMVSVSVSPYTDQQCLDLMGLRSSRTVVIFGPSYHLSPKGHIPRLCYRAQGEMIGASLADVLFRGTDYQPFRVISVVNSANQRKFVFNKAITLKQTFGKAVSGWKTQSGFKSYGIVQPSLTLTGDATLGTTNIANDTLIFPLSTTPTTGDAWSVGGTGTIYTNIFSTSSKTGYYKALDYTQTPDGSGYLPFLESASVNNLDEPAMPQRSLVTFVA